MCLYNNCWINTYIYVRCVGILECYNFIYNKGYIIFKGLFKGYINIIECINF